MNQISSLAPNRENFLAQNVQSPMTDGISHVFHQIEGESNVVQTQETGGRGFVDLEQMAQVSPAMALADITRTGQVDGVIT